MGFLSDLKSRVRFPWRPDTAEGPSATSQPEPQPEEQPETSGQHLEPEDQTEHDEEPVRVEDVENGANQEDEGDQQEVEMASETSYSASTVPDEPSPSKELPDFYVQSRGHFTKTTQDAFLVSSFLRSRAYSDSRLIASVDSAIMIQASFRNIAIVSQGFLSGLAAFHCAAAFSLIVNEETVKAYQQMAVFAHTAIYLCFTISVVYALDRFESGGSFLVTFKRWLGMQRGGLTLLLSLVGMVATVLCSGVEEDMASERSVRLSSQLGRWRWLSLARAVSAVGCWLMVALPPRADFTADHLDLMIPRPPSSAKPSQSTSTAPLA